MADNKAEARAQQQKRIAATCQQDVAALTSIIADDLVYTHSNARQDTKASLIANMQSGQAAYQAIDASDVVAQDPGDAVVLTGVAQIKVSSNGNPNSFGVRFVEVYAKRDGDWKMVTWQTTRLP